MKTPRKQTKKSIRREAIEASTLANETGTAAPKNRGAAPTIIRPAGFDDVGDLVALGRAYFDQIGAKVFTEFHEPSFATVVHTLISGQTPGVLLVAESAGKLMGMTGGVLFPIYFNVHTQIAQEMFRFALPDFVGGEAELANELSLEMQRRGAHVFLPVSSLLSPGAQIYAGQNVSTRKLAS